MALLQFDPGLAQAMKDGSDRRHVHLGGFYLERRPDYKDEHMTVRQYTLHFMKYFKEDHKEEVGRLDLAEHDLKQLLEILKRK